MNKRVQASAGIGYKWLGFIYGRFGDDLSDKIKKPVSEQQRLIGARLKALATRHSGGMEGFGEKFGKSESALKVIFDGTSCTQFAKLEDYARYLGSTPNEILGFDDIAPAPVVASDELNVLIEALLASTLEGGETEAVKALARSAIELLSESALAEVGLDQQASMRAQVALMMRRYRKARGL